MPIKIFRSYPISRHLRSVALIFGVLLTLGVGAQDENLKFYDNTYVENVRSVRLNIRGFPHSYPLIELGGSAQLQLSFDDTSDEVVRYSYRFIHCNQDWQPSSLSPLEFNSGFTVDYLETYDFSLRTLKNYVHYDLVFPNRNMKLDVSGNYLLAVYNAEDDEFPVITRRFMVQETVAGVSGNLMRAADIDKIHTNQEIDLSVSTKQMQLRAPLQELSATVIQNNRWDNAMIGIRPNFLGRESVRFDYQGKVSFRGLNEYRNLDIRSIRTPRTRMASITNEAEHYSMMLLRDLPRGGGGYLNYFDLNGDFINVRDDQAQINIADDVLQANFSRFQVDFNGEYVQMTFVLDTEGELDQDVYIIGGLTEYQLKPEFRMVWNPTIGAYVGRALLKQGFYNYHYVTEAKPGGKKPHPADRLDYSLTEGSFDETENDYLALIYWRPFGGRYDRLVGTAVLNSNVD
ncbi:type IX secretion system plug protein [Neolewinella antarctica]|uniref:Type 9 secretion system plug protein N-terminal domain-containing protein n=1 Tax=Neolewinella antarctica TaxID=442734 RepID=A0ABX0XC79_9BACT|nr:DUF5103 domain-containing protein [Neolewinella antarctica]NJC26554.1 hypothetical protein [Neolewinella antarctica]